MKRVNLILKTAASFFSSHTAPACDMPPEGTKVGGTLGRPIATICRFCRASGGSRASGSVFFDWDKWDNWDSIDFIRFFCPTLAVCNWDNWDTRGRCRPQSFRCSFIWCLVSLKSMFFSADKALLHRRPHAARLTLTRLTGLLAGLVVGACTVVKDQDQKWRG